MRRCLLLSLLLALPARAQSIQGILVEPPNPTSRDRIELTVAGTQHPECPIVWGTPTLDRSNWLFEIPATFPECGSPIPAEFGFRKTFVLDPQEARTYYAKVEVAGLPGATSYTIFEVVEPSGLLRLTEGDLFRVNVAWKNHRDGSEGAGLARRLADDSGAFWFFSPENVEVTIKILDGRPINGSWWVFIASMTDLELRVSVVENRNDCLSIPTVPPSCPQQTYVQAAGQNRNFIDFNGFPQ